jgi:hypothetical protein
VIAAACLTVLVLMVCGFASAIGDRHLIHRDD